MSTLIRLIDEKGSIINQQDGIDFGKSRIGFPVSIPFKVFNASNEILYNVTLKASGSESASWKQFKIYKDEAAVKQINLGNLRPLSYYEAVKNINAEFIKDMMVSEMWNTGIIDYKNDSIKFIKNTQAASGISGARLEFNIGFPRDLEIEFKTKMEVDKTFDNYDTTLINFPVRMNSSGNRKGYCISFRRRRKDDKFYVAIYKDGLGMVDNDDRDYGTNLYNTGWLDYNEEKFLKFKLYNDLYNQPCIEIYYDNKLLTLYDSLKPSIKTNKYVDKTDTAYNKGGKFYFDYTIWNGDISLEILDMNIKTESPEHFVTIETVVDYNAINNKEYNSTLEVSYEQESKGSE